MSTSGKRYNNANLNSLFDKQSGQGSATGGATGGVVHKGMLILQGHRANQRSRLAPHPSGGKLAVPKPVNLPSLRKENQGNDPNTQLVPASGGTGSWHKTEDQHVAPDGGVAQNASAKGSGAWQTGSGGGNSSQPQQGQSGTTEITSRLLGTVPEGQDSQFLNQEEYPTLEAATNNKPVAKGKKQDKSPKSSRGTPKESQDGLRAWSEDERPSQRRSWFEDERLAPSDSFGGYSSWGDTEYRPPPYATHGGRGPYHSHHGPYYVHDQGMYSVPPEGDRDRGGYHAGRGVGHSYSESHQRDVYHGHHQHSPYMSGGSYHHEYRPSYEYGSDPYMDRSLFPPPPPPPPPPRSRDDDDQDGCGRMDDGLDPEREEYNAELKKRAMELGAKMECGSHHQSSGTSQQGENLAEGQLKLVRRPADGSVRESTVHLARLPGNNEVASSMLPGSSSTQFPSDSEDAPGATSTQHSKNSGQPSSRNDESDSAVNDREVPLSSRGKGMDWEAQVDAEEKAKAAKRERAIRDAQMRLEPPTVLKPAPRNEDVAPVQVLRTAMPAQPVPQRNVKTQSIGIQAQPPTPPASQDSHQNLREDRETPRDLGTSTSRGHGHGEGPVHHTKPSVPGPWGQRPPASVQAQRQAHALVQPLESLPNSAASSPRPPSHRRQVKSEKAQTPEAEGREESSRGQRPEISHGPRETAPNRGSDGYGHHSGRSDNIHRHMRDNPPPRTNRERGRGRGRGNTRYESRADQADWRQPRDPEAKQHLGRMRSDYVGGRGGHQGLGSGSERRSSIVPQSPSASVTGSGSQVASFDEKHSGGGGGGGGGGGYGSLASKGHTRLESVGSSHSRKISQSDSHASVVQDGSRAATGSPNSGQPVGGDPVRVQEVEKTQSDGPLRREGSRRPRTQVGKEKGGRYEAVPNRLPHGQPREKSYEVVQGSARPQVTSQGPQAANAFKPPSHSPRAPSSVAGEHGQKSSSRIEDDQNYSSQGNIAGGPPQSSRPRTTQPRPARVQQVPKEAAKQSSVPPRVPLASGVGSQFQSTNPNPAQPSGPGHMQETQIQFGQFHMKSLLNDGTFSVPPGEFGSLKSRHLNPETAQAPAQEGKKAEELSKTGQGVDCLPRDLIETPPHSTHKANVALAPATAPSPRVASSSQVPVEASNNEIPPDESSEQVGAQPQTRGVQLQGHSHRGRGRGWRGGRGFKGRGGFNHDRSDSHSDNASLSRQRNGDSHHPRSESFSRGSGRGSGFQKGAGRGNGTGGRGEGSHQHDQGGRVAQGPARSEGGGGRSFGRGRHGRGIPGRGAKPEDSRPVRTHGVLRMDKEQGEGSTDHQQEVSKDDERGVRGSQDVGFSTQSDRGGRGRGHVPGRGRGRGIHEGGRGGSGRGQSEHSLSRDGFSGNRGRGGRGRNDRGGDDGNRGGQGHGRGQGQHGYAQWEAPQSTDDGERGSRTKSHTGDNLPDDGKEVRQPRRDAPPARGRGFRGGRGRGRGRGRGSELSGGPSRQTWSSSKAPSESQTKPDART